MASGVIGSILGGIFTGGAGPAIGAGIGAAMPGLTDIAKTITDRLLPNPERDAELETRKLELQREIETVLTQRATAEIAMIQLQNSEQAAINLATTQGGGIWNSGWRPATAWICVAAFALNFLINPLIIWAGSILGVALGFTFPTPPTFATSDFMPILIALLGLSGLRTAERVQGVSSPSPAAHNPAIPRR